jgi:hypothetical protein
VEDIPPNGMGKRRNIVKVTNLIRTLAPLLVLAFSATAFAGSGSFSLDSAARLNGKVLAPGHYKAKWDNRTPETDVTLLQGRHEVATVHAKLVDQGKPRFTSVETRKNPDGSTALVELRFRGKESALVFD